MNQIPERLNLQIDVLDLQNQRAQPIPHLKPPQLIAAILQEFEEVAYLGKDVDAYVLTRSDSTESLDDSLPLHRQVSQNERLILLERERPLPSSTVPPADLLYLREPKSGEVYRLHWLPALIGRSSGAATEQIPVAVNLAQFNTSQKVSRKHAQIVQENGHYAIQSLSDQNPTLIQTKQGDPIQLTSEPHPIHHQDRIVLERSELTLEFLIRSS